MLDKNLILMKVQEHLYLMHPKSSFQTASNRPQIGTRTMTQIADRTLSSTLFDIVVFLLPNLVIDPSFMSTSLLVPEF